MSEKDREILKAYFYGYSIETISELEDKTIEEVKSIINNNSDNITKELERRYNG